MSERCCYFLQTHRDPDQVLRLVRTLRTGSPRSLVVIQHNPAGCKLDHAPLQALGDVHLLDIGYRQIRGNWSCQVQPTLDAMAWLGEQRIDYDWLVTLTGQDYPVMPLAQSERILRDGGHDAFLRHWDVLAPGSPWPRHKPVRRYWYRYARYPRVPMPALRLLRTVSHLVPGLYVSLFYGPFVGVRARRNPWHDGYRCYGGWAWGALRREAVAAIVEAMRTDTALVEFYRHTMSPEESILQTILCNDGRFRVHDDDLRYIDYTGTTTGSPRTLGCADVPVLTSGRYAIARKFDPAVDAVVFDRLDEHLFAGTTTGGLAPAS
jgi:hypothetical protein